MGFTILMIIEGLCIIPFILIRDQEGKRRIDNDDLIKIEAGFIIVASILNWFAFGSSHTGFSVLGVGGYYGAEELNIIGLAWSIIPPVLVDFISYLLYLLMTKIRYRIHSPEGEKDRKKEKKEYKKKKIKGVIGYLELDDFWLSLSSNEQEALIQYYRYSFEQDPEGSPIRDTKRKNKDRNKSDIIRPVRTRLEYLDSAVSTELI